ncbi:TIGR03083 family protein [Frankineae bacterium MT45]|nr:TIGR03083 family protein [Frankineae bacterium MT45]
MSTADPIIAALRTGHDDLQAIVVELSDDDLARPSAASEWEIAQVLSHLGSGAEINRATLEAALGRREVPGADFNPSVWDRWNAMSPREQADGFVAASSELTELYESIDDATRETMRIEMGFLPAPVDLATAGRLRLNELTLHAWDVRVGLGEGDNTLPADAADALLHGAPNMLAWISKPDQLDGQRAVIRVLTTGTESEFSLTLDAPVSIDFEVPGEVDGTLSLPAEAWLRLVAGRLPQERTPAEVTATGAADLDLLRRVFPGY